MNTLLTPDEIGNQGNALFEAKIKSHVSGQDPDLFLAIDINSGDYEVAPDDMTPSQQLHRRRPGASRIPTPGRGRRRLLRREWLPGMIQGRVNPPG